MAVSKKKTGNIEKSAMEAAKAAASAGTKRTATAGRKPQAGQFIGLRIDPVELENLKETFNQYGETLSGGLKRSAYYVMQELKAGRLDMTKAGIFEIRG